MKTCSTIKLQYKPDMVKVWHAAQVILAALRPFLLLEKEDNKSTLRQIRTKAVHTVFFSISIKTTFLLCRNRY